METIKTVFDDRFKAMEDAAKAKGLNLTIVCKKLGISRATPDRWKRETPKTIELLQQMEEFVNKSPAAAESAAAPQQS